MTDHAMTPMQPRPARSALRATFRLALLAALVAASLLGGAALAQDTPPAAPEPVTFGSVPACQSFADELLAVTEDSAKLADALPADVASRDVLLAGIFQGTQTMLAYGERLFNASDQYEEKCKSALRAGDQAAEIGRIYELVLEPTLRGYDFLVRVRDAAKTVGDEQTVSEMDGAIAGYRESTFKLIGFCEQDLPEDLAAARCGELRKIIDARME